jgi:hypothetical protein
VPAAHAPLIAATGLATDPTKKNPEIFIDTLPARAYFSRVATDNQAVRLSIP